jgi:hypothetical protein
VPEDVNDSETGTADVIENALEVVFEAASIALKTKLKVVVEPVELSVPDIIAVPPSAAVFVIE